MDLLLLPHVVWEPPTLEVLLFLPITTYTDSFVSSTCKIFQVHDLGLELAIRLSYSSKLEDNSHMVFNVHTAYVPHIDLEALED